MRRWMYSKAQSLDPKGPQSPQHLDGLTAESLLGRTCCQYHRCWPFLHCLLNRPAAQFFDATSVHVWRCRAHIAVPQSSSFFSESERLASGPKPLTKMLAERALCLSAPPGAPCAGSTSTLKPFISIPFSFSTAACRRTLSFRVIASTDSTSVSRANIALFLSVLPAAPCPGSFLLLS